MQPSHRIFHLGLAVVLVAAGSRASANVTVILQSGGRIEATSAYETPKGWELSLPGGGSLALTAESVRRVSHEATDLPHARRVGVAVSSPAFGGAASSPAEVAGEPQQFPRFQAEPEGVKVPRAVSLRAQGSPGEAPRGIMPTAAQSAARQAAERAASTNPLTGVIQRYSPNTGGATGTGARDPMATVGMHRAFGRPTH